jgi:hypothetical protein
MGAQDDGWRTIDSAPLDGTWVLLLGGRTNEDDYMSTGVNINRPVVAFYLPDPYDPAWVFCFWDGSWRSVYDNPTHWKSLDLPSFTSPPETAAATTTGATGPE